MNKHFPYLLSSRDVASLFSVHARTVFNWFQSGKIHGWYTLGGHLRFSRIEVANCMRLQGLSPPKTLWKEPFLVSFQIQHSLSEKWFRQSLEKYAQLTKLHSIFEVSAPIALFPEYVVLDLEDDAEFTLQYVKRMKTVSPHPLWIGFCREERLKNDALLCGFSDYIVQSEPGKLREFFVKQLA